MNHDSLLFIYVAQTASTANMPVKNRPLLLHACRGLPDVHLLQEAACPRTDSGIRTLPSWDNTKDCQCPICGGHPRLRLHPVSISVSSLSLPHILLTNLRVPNRMVSADLDFAKSNSFVYSHGVKFFCLRTLSSQDPLRPS